MALTPAMQAAYRKLWNFIQPASVAKTETGSYSYTSSDILSAAASIYRQAGQSLTFQESQGVFGLVSIARSNQRAIDTLNAMNPSEQIGASAIAAWPTQRPLEVQAAQPTYMARGLYSYTDMAGNQQTAWITLSGIDQMPPTAASIAAGIQAAAITARSPLQGSKSKYLPADQMDTFGSVISIQLYAV